jgi:glycine dehydrogenase
MRTFQHRHIGPNESELAEMLGALGLASLDELIDAAIPGSIRFRGGRDQPAAPRAHAPPRGLRAQAPPHPRLRAGRGDG